MSEILSQSEIDLLINAVSTGQPAPPEIYPEGQQAAVKKYDFRKPNKFTKDQLRTMYLINENLSRILSNFLSGYLRSSVDIRIAAVEQSTYEEFLLSISSPVLLTVFQMMPLNGSAVMEFGNNFTTPAIDLLFGGLGTRNSIPKELTEIEMRVLKHLLEKVLENMATAWADVFRFQPVIESMETTPQFIQIISPNETVAIITFTAEIASNQSIIYLCFPWATLKDAIPSLTAQNWFATQKYLENTKTRDIENSLKNVELNLSACCGETELTVKEFLQLEIGDVILLNTVVGEDMQLLVEGNPKYKIQPGLIGNKLAAVVTGKI